MRNIFIVRNHMESENWFFGMVYILFFYLAVVLYVVYAVSETYHPINICIYESIYTQSIYKTNETTKGKLREPSGYLILTFSVFHIVRTCFQIIILDSESLWTCASDAYTQDIIPLSGEIEIESVVDGFEMKRKSIKRIRIGEEMYRVRIRHLIRPLFAFAFFFNWSSYLKIIISGNNE